MMNRSNPADAIDVPISEQGIGPRLAYSRSDGGEQHILATHCPHCGYNNFPPSRVCAQCMSLDVAPLALSRRGVLYSYTTMRSEAGTVYVGYVDLPEKIRLFAELAGFDADQPPSCGLDVALQAIRYSVEDKRPAGPVFVFQGATV